MTYAEALAFFGGRQVDLARVLLVSQSTISQWKGQIPAHYQFRLQVLSGNTLLVDADLIPAELRSTAPGSLPAEAPSPAQS